MPSIPLSYFRIGRLSSRRLVRVSGLPDKKSQRPWLCLAVLLTAIIAFSGCTSLRQYVSNGFKVGPNYCKPVAQVAPEWIDANDKRVRSECEDLSKWWAVFKDESLDTLICCAYRQNLTFARGGLSRVAGAGPIGNHDGANLPPKSEHCRRL